jgi:hypothetical protein
LKHCLWPSAFCLRVPSASAYRASERDLTGARHGAANQPAGKRGKKGKRQKGKKQADAALAASLFGS